MCPRCVVFGIGPDLTSKILPTTHRSSGSRSHPWLVRPGLPGRASPDVGRSGASGGGAGWVYFARSESPKHARRAAGPGYTWTHPACRSESSVKPPHRTPTVAIFALPAASAS
jgi:hypothetical protein